MFTQFCSASGSRQPSHVNKTLAKARGDKPFHVRDHRGRTGDQHLSVLIPLALVDEDLGTAGLFQLPQLVVPAEGDSFALSSYTMVQLKTSNSLHSCAPCRVGQSPNRR